MNIYQIEKEWHKDHYPLRKKKAPEFQCLECGKAFYSVKTAEKAALNGCPKCGGVDIDIDIFVERKEE